ncbi:DNA polymerase III subunit delta' [Tropicimonas sp. S265A]|uniref:DNA polymerase III subunit delta' n=1 Tax=Tropicimonas sp. S265A TaxID=3415134 RepID=UPI003C7BCF8C
MDVPAEAPAPEADRQPGAPHPRETTTLFGQDAAERAFLEAFNAGRLHHAWLLSGPEGIGKATLAWRIARFLLTRPLQSSNAGGGLFGEDLAPAPPRTLDTDPDHPAVRRAAALSEPRLFLLRRPWDAEKGRFKQDIPVDEVRRLKSFFNFSAVDGGRRVVIVDAADDLNTAAANALLKVLEEPPRDTVLLLVSHAPSRLLPTIRSRCRSLPLRQLADQDLSEALRAAFQDDAPDLPALIALADGSAGRALQLHEAGGPEAYAALIALLSDLPRLDRPAMVKLADSAAARGAEDRFDLLLTLTEFFLHRLARTGAMGAAPSEAVQGEGALLARLCPTPAHARIWAQTGAEIVPRARAGRAVNLDASALLIDMFLGLQSTAAGPAAA